MKTFDYLQPRSVPDAVKALAANGDAKPLAGGQSLLGAMKLGLATPAALVDLRRVPDLHGVRVDARTVTVGAMTTHAEIAAHAEVRRAAAAIASLARGIGDRQVRHRGTIGGAIANADPAACWPAAVVGLGATVTTDRRALAGDTFFRGLYETALAPDELVTSVTFPIPQQAVYLKFRQAASRFALVGVFVARFADGVRVGVTGAGTHAFRATAFEQALSRRFAVDALDGLAMSADGLNDDLHASPAYRAHLVGVLARRAVAALS